MIAEVALNLPLRRTFDYRLPAEEAEQVVPGSRVIVPFGTRLRAGIVVGLKPTSPLPAARLKTIQRGADSATLFAPELLDFTRWIAEYYFCGWGEVLEAALPSGMGVRFRTRYRWHAQPPPSALEGLSPRARTFLGQADEWDASQWNRLAQDPADRQWLWRQLRPGGLVEARYEYAGLKARRRTERWVRPITTPSPPPGRRNAKRETRREIILRVLQQEGEVPIGRLKALMKDPGAVLRQLAREGSVALVERPLERRLAVAMPPPEPFLPLNPEQQTAYAAIEGALEQGAYRGFLLQGVTGSGKTEVYLHAVRAARARARSCLLLVPEIALTAAIVDRFRSRFGAEVAVLHSGMGEGERFDEWNRVREGRATIVIGPRSAVFAPLKNLGLVVVDEEHDTSYKQDEAPRYHGRDSAMLRALRNKAVVVLGSATPSMEAERNVALGKLTRLRLHRRVEDRPLPRVDILDLRATPRQPGCAIFTRPLVEALRETLLRGEQAIVFLNRRGYGNLVRCTLCEETLVCANCSITLTYHQAQQRLLCHRCEFEQVLPERCPACNGEGLQVVGLGTERIEQEIATLFPTARVLRMDSDTLRRRGELERMMAAIRARRYDVIIGTQVLSKGHDFPYITLVGAVLADVSLNIPDFRAPERTFQLLTQMAGRAGRGEWPGRVLIQTYNPQHYSLLAVRGHDTEAFAEAELALRAARHAPPFAGQVMLWVSASEPAAAEKLGGRLARRLRGAARNGVTVLGPAEAPIRRLNNRYRWMILLRAPSVAPIQRLLRSVFDGPRFGIGVKERVTVDVDPYNLL